MDRVSTGSDVLDSVLDGGFSVGSLVAVTGPPGVGKTIFTANWIYNGVERLGCKGLYVSFVEGRKSFIENMRGLGLDFERLERAGKFRFLEMVTLKEIGVPAIIEQVLGEVADMGANMLVIDSFSAVSQVIEKSYDTRMLVHTVLSKIVREMGCTTMIIIEKTSAEETYEPAEFLSDFIIHFNKAEVDGAPLRYLKILKARGTEVRQPQLAFTLRGGFRVFRPLPLGSFPEPTKRFKIVPHGEDYYSSGISDLDKIVGPMFRRGCYNLLEVESTVPLSIERTFRVILVNVLNQGGCAVILPPQGLSAVMVWRALEPFVYEDDLRRNLKIVDFRTTAGETAEGAEPCVIPFSGRFIREDMLGFWNAVSEFRSRYGKPVFTIVGFDTLEYIYGKDELLKILGEDLSRIRNFGDIRLNIIRPERAIAGHLSSLADVHLKVREICGAIFLQGIKPKTPLLNIELHTDEEGSEIKLTPIL